MTFRDRRDAGQKLAQALRPLLPLPSLPPLLLIALPRGGVIVAAEIAKALKLPLDIIVPRKIGAEGNPEYAIGAITETGSAIFNENEIRVVDKEWLKQEMEKEKKE